jgi:hypothetical protein
MHSINYNNRNRNNSNGSNNGSGNDSSSNVNFIDSFDDNTSLHPQLYCRICDVLMMFMLNGKFANKYFCGMCGVTEDPEESEFYSKHVDQLRSVDDDDGNSSNNGGGGVSKYRYEDMIVQSKGNNQQQSSMQQKSERQPQMTNQRQKQSSPRHGLTQDGSNNDDDDDWASKELKRDLEANGIRQVVTIMDIDDITTTYTHGNDDRYHHHQQINRITRPR